jgi:hypothetical protein
MPSRRKADCIHRGEGAERQLFEYAFHAGVPLAILTDGQEWHFFLPAEQGNYAERRVYKLDIVERDISESAARLTRYLEYAEICSGRAINAAREDYKNVSRNRQILATLPEAWSKLVEEEDDLLLELLADKTESLCGYKPDVDGVARFLREKVSVHIASPSVPPKAKPPATKPVVPDLTTIPTGPVPAARIGFSLDGRFVACKTGREVLVQVFEALSHRDATFPERFAARPKHGRTRRYLARSPEELYPGRPDLAREHYTKLKSGWYVGTNVSLAQIRRILGMACEVAGFHLGRELVLDLGE